MISPIVLRTDMRALNSSEPRSNNRNGEFRGGASQRAFDSVKKDVSCFRCGKKGPHCQVMYAPAIVQELW